AHNNQIGRVDYAIAVLVFVFDITGTEITDLRSTQVVSVGIVVFGNNVPLGFVTVERFHRVSFAVDSKAYLINASQIKNFVLNIRDVEHGAEIEVSEAVVVSCS